MHLLKLILLIFCLLIAGVRAQVEVLQLEGAMEIARENSPDLKQTQLSLERSQELLNAQKAALRSRFSLNLEPLEYSNNRQFSGELNTWRTIETTRSMGIFSISQPLIWTDGTLSLQNQFVYRDSDINYDQSPLGIRDSRSRTYSNNLYLALDQPIFTYNRRKLELEDVRLDLENAWLNYKIQELMLEQRVAQSFFDVYQKKMRLRVAREELLNTRNSHKIIRNKVDAGLAAKEELYQSELNLANSRSGVYNSQVALENALDRFKQLIGISLYDSIDVIADISREDIRVDLQQAIDYGLKNRMELRQHKIDIYNAKANLIRASGTNEFKGNISLAYGIIGNDERFDDVYQAPTKNQNLSLSLEIPLYDWGEKDSRIKAADISVKSSKLTAEEQRKSIIIGIREAFRNVKNQTLQIDIAQQNVKNAQLTYDINLERYENGDLTSMDLKLSQNQLSQAKIGLVDAIIAYKLALLDLKVQSLWDFEKERPVLIE